VIDFISVPVTAGFTSAAAITIAGGQVDELFGIKVVQRSSAKGISKSIAELVNNWNTMRWEDTTLGLICCVLLLSMRAMKDVTWFDGPGGDQNGTCMQRLCLRFSPPLRRILSRVVWLFSTARNAVIVFVCVGVAMAFDGSDIDKISDDNSTFILTGKIDSEGIPTPEVPPFSYKDRSGEEMGFTDMLSELGSALIILPLIAILENMAIAKAFCKTNIHFKANM